MESFRRAVEVGAHAIETDLRLSRDGVVVLMHVSSIPAYLLNSSYDISIYTLIYVYMRGDSSIRLSRRRGEHSILNKKLKKDP